MKKILALNIIFLFIISAAPAQQEPYESPAGAKFLLYTPPGYSSNTATYPLLLSLHSKGEVSNDLSELTSKNPEQMPCRLIYLNRWPEDLPFIVLTPQLKPDPSDPEIQWSAEYIDEVVRYVLKNYRVDLNRIYVTGISRGGTGAWTYASAYPEKVAALLPMSGRSDLTQACPIKDIPVWAFHGDADGIAPTDYSIDMVNAIKACQPSGIYKPRLNIFHARNHNGWNEVYNGTSGYKVYDWLLMFIKNDTSNKKPYVNAGRDLRIKLRNDPLHIIGDFFDFDGEVTNVSWKQTSGPTLTLQDTGSGSLKITDLKPGVFGFELTVIDNQGAKSSDLVILEIADSSISPSINALILIDGKTNQEIGNLSEGQIINKTALGITEINIKALSSEGTGSVMFSVNTDQNTRIVNTPGPYLIKSQTSAPEWKINNGEYLICATPFPQTNARGIPGVSQCFKVSFTDVVTPPYQDSGGSAPVASITSPEAGQTFTAPATVTISANASDSDGSVTKVEFYNGTTKVGEDISSPYAFTWNNVSSGSYTIVAKAIDNTGLSDTASVDILVTSGGSGNNQPVVNITNPQQGQSFSAPASVNISASASVNGENITKVEFYNGLVKLGEDATSPYTYSWNNVPSGNYNLIAKATDNNATSASTSVDISVTSTGSPYAETGTIQRELWTGIQHNDVGSDSTAEGWQLSDGIMERPIPGNRLSPFFESPSFTFFDKTHLEVIEAGTANMNFQIFPNPVQTGVSEFTISGYEGKEKAEKIIEIISITGEIIFTEKILCDGDCNGYLMNIDRQLIRGVYVISLTLNGRRFSKRLLVK